MGSQEQTLIEERQKEFTNMVMKSPRRELLSGSKRNSPILQQENKNSKTDDSEEKAMMFSQQSFTIPVVRFKKN